MPTTKTANVLSVTKASNGISIVFPDVCKAPGVVSSAPVTIPYPTFAQTAVKSQKTAVGQKTPVTSNTSVVSTGAGVTAGVSKSPAATFVMVGSTNVIIEGEVAMLKGSLMQLHNKINSLNSDDPDEWQQALQDYAVMVSALFVTLRQGGKTLGMRRTSGRGLPVE